MTQFISADTQDGVTTLAFERPETMNAIGTLADCADIVSAITAAQQDPTARAIILTGRGKAFSTGGNLRGMKERTGIGRLESPASTCANYREGVHSVVRALYGCELPLIAAINGYAIGLGLDLALLCDIRLAAHSAKFGASFINVGLVPGDGGAWTLMQATGYSRAAELFLTGDSFGADEAFAFGMVSRVVPADQLLDEARAVAARIVKSPAVTVRLTKRLLREAQHQRLSDLLELSAAYQAIAHETADHEEAVDAFLEKRAPIFTGR